MPSFFLWRDEGLSSITIATLFSFSRNRSSTALIPALANCSNFSRFIIAGSISRRKRQKKSNNNQDNNRDKSNSLYFTLFVGGHSTKKHGKCSQRYLREDLLIAQLKNRLQKIALCPPYAYRQGKTKISVTYDSSGTVTTTMTGFGRRENNWIEPLREWILTAYHAEKLA